MTMKLEGRSRCKTMARRLGHGPTGVSTGLSRLLQITPYFRGSFLRWLVFSTRCTDWLWQRLSLCRFNLGGLVFR